MKLKFFLLVFLCSSFAFASPTVEKKGSWRSDVMIVSGIVVAVASTIVMAFALDGLQAQKRTCTLGGTCTTLPLERSALTENGIIASVSGMSILGSAVLIVLGALKAPDVMRF